jgi:hypothetical protein
MTTKLTKTQIKKLVHDAAFTCVARAVASDEWFDVDTLEVELQKQDASLYQTWSEMYNEDARYTQLCKVLKDFDFKFKGSAYDLDLRANGNIGAILVRTEKDGILAEEIDKLASEQHKQDDSLSGYEYFCKLAADKNLFFIELD